jgi:AraC-like DNA-binding protein
MVMDNPALSVDALAVDALDTTVRHTAHVCAVADGHEAAAGIEEVSTSWQRSANAYRLDPADSHAPGVLTPGEIDDRREPLLPLIRSAREELDGLYDLVCRTGYVVLLCDTGGIAVEHRGEQQRARDYEYWGTWLGGVWPEEVEGTNGIGTCIAERRAITVHRSQHFRSRNKDLSCSGVPIFGDDGTLLAVLDVSAIDPDLAEHAHALTGVLTVNAARAIEERRFRERFHRAWIVAAARTDGGGMLLAVDADQRIVGADRAARDTLMLDAGKLDAGISLWSVFERDLSVFRRKEAGDFPARFTIAGSKALWPALVTPPSRLSGFGRNGASVALHARPRLELVRTLRQIAPEPPARSGLPAATMRRIVDYVDAHLGESIDLATLASVAGISVFHFARQFKQSADVTPHQYVVRRRIERAKEMLAGTDMSLSGIAYATGFSDQAHFARSFRWVVGTAPRAFRWMSR